MDQRETAWRREAHDRYDNYAMLARLFQREVDAELLADLKESFAAEPTAITGSTKAVPCCASIWTAWKTWPGAGRRWPSTTA